MKTINELLSESILLLQQEGVLEPKMMCEEILAEILRISSANLPLIGKQILTKAQLNRFYEYFEQVCQNKPLAYIFHSCPFRDFHLKITPATLIPRVETELFVDLIINALSKNFLKGKTLVDMGTGSGAIAIAIKRAFPELEVIMVDVSAEALQVAIENAKNCHVDIEALQGDLFDPLHDRKIDYFISNPPYVSKKEFEELDASVKDYEPKLALLGGGEGLDFYRSFAKQLPQCLNPGGKAFFEMGYLQAKSLQKIFSDSIWVKKEIFPDYAGKERFFFLEIQ